MSTSDDTSSFSIKNSQAEHLFQITADGVVRQNGLTEAERVAIVSPLAGMMVFQSTTPAGLYIYDGSSWVGLTQAVNAADVSSAGTQTLTNKTLTAPTINTATLNSPAINNGTLSNAILNNGSISGSDINNSAIGVTTAASASFTTLSSSGTATLNAGLEVRNGSASAGQVRLFEDLDDGSNKVTLQPSAMTADYTLTLPADAGADGELLSTDGSGLLSWQAAGDVTLTGSQTLANKTLTAPRLTAADINGASLSGILSGAPTFSDVIVLARPDINGGSIDGVTIGASNASSASFTNLAVSALSQLSGHVDVRGGSGAAGQIRLYENASSGTNKVTLKSPAIANDYSLTLPVDDGDSGEFLSTDGAGVLQWAAVGDVLTMASQTLSNKTLTSPSINGSISISNGSSSAAEIILFEDSDDGGNKLTLRSQAMTADVTLTLPSDDGSAGQALTTDGAGNLSWASSGGGGFVGARVYLGNFFTVNGIATFIKIPFDSVSYDVGSNVTDGDFVAPSDGYYQINSCVYVVPVSDNDNPFRIRLSFFKQDSEISKAYFSVVNTKDVSFCMSDLLALTKDDVVSIKVRSAGDSGFDNASPKYSKIAPSSRATYYSIHKVGS